MLHLIIHYIALLLNPKLKEEGLINLGLSSGFISDIKTKLKEVYNK